MIVQLFGVLDISAGILLVLSRFGYWGQIMLVVGVLMLIKSLVYFCGVVSVVDALGALLMVAFALDYYAPHVLIAIMFALWFLQKGFFSFLSS